MIGCPETEKQKTAPLALCLQPPKTSVLILSSSTQYLEGGVLCSNYVLCYYASTYYVCSMFLLFRGSLFTFCSMSYVGHVIHDYRSSSASLCSFLTADLPRRNAFNICTFFFRTTPFFFNNVLVQNKRQLLTPHLPIASYGCCVVRSRFDRVFPSLPL